MFNLTMQHINSICHAELLIDTGLDTRGSAKLRAKIEDDLLRLAEVKLYIINRLAEPPKLPFEGDPDDPSINVN